MITPTSIPPEFLKREPALNAAVTACVGLTIRSNIILRPIERMVIFEDD
jgi:hypothetical protein